MKAEFLMDFHKNKHEMGVVSKSKSSLRPNFNEKLQPLATAIQNNLAHPASPIQLCPPAPPTSAPPSHPIIPTDGAASVPGHKSISPKHPESDTEDPDEILNLEGSEEDCSNFQILGGGGGGPNQHLPDHPFGHQHKFEVSRIVTKKC